MTKKHDDSRLPPDETDDIIDRADYEIETTEKLTPEMGRALIAEIVRLRNLIKDSPVPRPSQNG